MAQVKPVINSVWGSTGATTDPGTTKMNLGWTAETPTHNVQNFWQQRADEMLTHLNEQGIAEWDNVTTYPIDGWAKGSDGRVYRALQVATAQDPVSAPAFWTLSLSGGNSLATNGYQVLDGGLIIQWGIVANIPRTTAVNFALPVTFPNAHFIGVSNSNGSVADEPITSYEALSVSQGRIHAHGSGADPDITVNFIAIGN